MSVWRKGDNDPQHNKSSDAKRGQASDKNKKNELQQALDRTGNAIASLFTSKDAKWKKKGTGTKLGDAADNEQRLHAKAQALLQQQQQHSATAPATSGRAQQRPPLNPAAAAAAERAEQRAAASSSSSSSHSRPAARLVPPPHAAPPPPAPSPPASLAAHPVDEGSLELLRDMGFDGGAATDALRAAGGDIESAVALLSQEPAGTPPPPASAPTPAAFISPRRVAQPSTPAVRLAAVRACAATLAGQGDAARPPLQLMARLLKNAAGAPENAKYRTVRLSNDKIAAAFGESELVYDLLQLVGFELGKNEDADVVTLGDAAVASAVDCEALLLESIEAAAEAELGPRDVKVLFSAGVPPPPELPPDFYSLSGEEARALVAAAAARREAGAQLRTQAQRDAEAARRTKVYRAALVRVRFPDGTILQGLYSTRAAVSRLLEWVARSLRRPHVVFELAAARSPPLSVPTLSIGDAELAPASLLNFRVVDPADSSEKPFLTDELLSRIEPIGAEPLPQGLQAKVAGGTAIPST